MEPELRLGRNPDFHRAIPPPLSADLASRTTIQTEPFWIHLCLGGNHDSSTSPLIPTVHLPLALTPTSSLPPTAQTPLLHAALVRSTGELGPKIERPASFNASIDHSSPLDLSSGEISLPLIDMRSALHYNLTLPPFPCRRVAADKSAFRAGRCEKISPTTSPWDVDGTLCTAALWLLSR